MFDLIELFFFAYRDFVGDADLLLEYYEFGRAHHRVLHFVYRRPGLAIAGPARYFEDHQQSLNRVLKQLLDAGFVEARAGRDRPPSAASVPDGEGRASGSGAGDAAIASASRRVFGELPPEAREATADFLLAMVNVPDREKVRAHLPPRRRRRQLAEDDAA